MKPLNCLKFASIVLVSFLLLMCGLCFAQNERVVENKMTISIPPDIDTQDNKTLPSWNDGATKNAILEFLSNATNEDSPKFIKPEDRIATFDNDGTLWCEQPMPVQLDFVIKHWAAMAKANASLRETQPYKAIIEKDMEWFGGNNSQDILRGMGEAFTGMTAEDYENLVQNFFTEVQHPRFDVPYQQVAYKPMRELIDLLKANDFRVFIVSGGGRDFMRVISEPTYGIYRDRVIGTAPVHEYVDGHLVIGSKFLGEFNNGQEKVTHIFDYIGRMPVLAGGNSDGDIEMLESAQFSILVHHTDAEREYAYDKGAENALAAAKNESWTVVNMKDDWKTVFQQMASGEEDEKNKPQNEDEKNENQLPGFDTILAFACSLAAARRLNKAS